jgi:hypothetical protein
MKTADLVEKQKITQVWIWLVVFGILGLNIYAIIQQIVYGIPFGNNPSPDYFLYIILIIPIGLIVLLSYNKLHTKIDSSGIHYKYVPFHNKTHALYFDDIASVEVKTYNAIREFGGWGVRIGMKKGSGRALNVKGNHGIRIEMKNGKKLLIGTQKPDEAKQTIANFFNKNLNDYQ